MQIMYDWLPNESHEFVRCGAVRIGPKDRPIHLQPAHVQKGLNKTTTAQGMPHIEMTHRLKAEPVLSIPEGIIPRVVAAAGKLPGGVYEARRLQEVLNRAQGRALEGGAQEVTARDVIHAAQEMEWEKRHNQVRPAAPSHPPVHYSQQRQALGRLASLIDKEVKAGGVRPRVLVACEFTATVAQHFLAAGCEVMTCDLKDTEDKAILHYKGDARDVINQGFDLVIAHPPCTHLSNASSIWFSCEPERWKCLKSAAGLFSDLYHAEAK